MQKDTSDPVIKITFNTKTGFYGATFPQISIAPLNDYKNLELLMADIRDEIRNYKKGQRASNDIDAILAEIERMKQRVADLEESNDRPEYSFLDETQYDAYLIQVAPLSIEKINWFEQQRNVTVIGIDFCDTGKNSIYGSRLQHSWLYFPNDIIKKQKAENEKP